MRFGAPRTFFFLFILLKENAQHERKEQQNNHFVFDTAIFRLRSSMLSISCFRASLVLATELVPFSFLARFPLLPVCRLASVNWAFGREMRNYLIRTHATN